MYEYNSNTEWSYSINPPPNWNLPVSQDKWLRCKLSHIPKITTNSYYFRIQKRFDNLDEFSGFIINFVVLSGVIITINGKEIYRVNVPNGNLTKDTLANGIFQEKRHLTFILPISYLESDLTMIGIELHRHIIEKTFPIVEFFLTETYGNNENDCIVLNNYRQNIIGINSRNENIDFGFDMIYDSEWLKEFKEGDSLQLIMNFQPYTYVSINQFSITYFNSYDGSNPKKVDVYINKYIGYEKIGSFTDFSFLESNDYRDSRITTQTNLISSIIINITSIENLTKMKLSVRDFGFHLCPIRYCKAVDGLPMKISGSTLTVNCHNSLIGYRKLYCPNGRDAMWIETKNECKDPPILMDKIESYIITVGERYSNIRLFSFSGSNISYSMDKKILGMILNEDTGLLSGRPLKRIQKSNYTFFASNYFGQNIICIVYITVRQSELPILLWSNETIYLESGITYKKFKIFEVAGDDIIYDFSGFDFGLNIDYTTMEIYGMTLEEKEGDVVFRATNNYGTIRFSIHIIISTPNIPNLAFYTESLTLYYYELYNEKQVIICTGNKISYNVKPDLPSKLVLNNKKGILSGRVYQSPSPQQYYTFSCYNIYGYKSVDIPITIIYSNCPIIIYYNNTVLIKVGIRYIDLSYFNITGNSLIYSISPNLPDGLEYDVNTGKISGLIKKQFIPVNYTLFSRGSGKTVEFKFTLISYFDIYPIIIEGTVINNVRIVLDVSITRIPLFEAVGNELQVIVNPELPSGLFINDQEFYLYGVTNEYQKSQNYTFTVKNSYGSISVTIYFEIIAIYCNENQKFPKTLATTKGTFISIKCSGLFSGNKERYCFLNDETGYWSDIIDNCFIPKINIIGIAVSSLIILFILLSVIYIIGFNTFRRKASSKNLSLSHISERHIEM